MYQSHQSFDREGTPIAHIRAAAVEPHARSPQIPVPIPREGSCEFQPVSGFGGSSPSPSTAWIWLGGDISPMFQTERGVDDVILGESPQTAPFILSQWADNASGRAVDEGLGRDLHALRDQRIGPDDRLGTDVGAIEDCRSHADEDIIRNGAGMDDGGVTYGDIIADHAGKIVGEMDDGVVLDVRVVANHDAIDITAKYRVIPDARAVAEGDVADDDGGSGDVGPAGG